MKREILFKAKRVDNGEWVFGYLYQSEKESWITDSININLSTHRNFAWSQVNPETVCQFTGLLDKNGNKIFDKDRIKANVLAFSLGSHLGVIEVDKEFECIISMELLGIWLECGTEDESGYMVHFDYDFCEDENAIEGFEITGNIHD